MNSLDKQYQALLQDILDNGTKKQTRTGTDSISIFGRQIRHKMSEGFSLLTTKKMAWKQIVTELIWFLSGRTDLRWLLQHDNTIWVGDAYKLYLTAAKQLTEPDYFLLMEDPSANCVRMLTQKEFIQRILMDDDFNAQFGDLGSIYGKQWRSWKQFVPYNITEDGCKVATISTDQIANLISELKTNPDSRRLMVSAWNVGELDQMVLPPCHYGFQVYTRELTHQERSDLKNSPPYRYGKPANGKLIDERLLDSNNVPKRAISLMWNQRSVDVPLGLPFNIASYGLLLHLIAKMVNMVPDQLIGNLGDCHIYLNQVDGVREQLTRDPYELPGLRINTEFWPTESGECGVGPIDAQAVLECLWDDSFCACLMESDIQLVDYHSHPKIKFPLSN